MRPLARHLRTLQLSHRECPESLPVHHTVLQTQRRPFLRWGGRQGQRGHAFKKETIAQPGSPPNTSVANPLHLAFPVFHGLTANWAGAPEGKYLHFFGDAHLSAGKKNENNEEISVYYEISLLLVHPLLLIRAQTVIGLSIQGAHFEGICENAI